MIPGSGYSKIDTKRKRRPQGLEYGYTQLEWIVGILLMIGVPVALVLLLT